MLCFTKIIHDTSTELSLRAGSRAFSPASQCFWSSDNYFSDFLQSARARLVHSLSLSVVWMKRVWTFFQYSNDRVLKFRLSKQSFQWHQLDLHKSQFYNSRSRWAVFLNEHGEWRVTKIMWNWLMQNLITQMLVKKLLFVTNKVFCEIIVTTCRFANLHTVTVWQATVWTETRTWKFRFLEQT